MYVRGYIVKYYVEITSIFHISLTLFIADGKVLYGGIS
jgi:transcriptional antiterminator Rof (Rho-off)